MQDQRCSALCPIRHLIMSWILWLHGSLHAPLPSCQVRFSSYYKQIAHRKLKMTAGTMFGKGRCQNDWAALCQWICRTMGSPHFIWYASWWCHDVLFPSIPCCFVLLSWNPTWFLFFFQLTCHEIWVTCWKLLHATWHNLKMHWSQWLQRYENLVTVLLQVEHPCVSLGNN